MRYSQNISNIALGTVWHNYVTQSEKIISYFVTISTHHTGWMHCSMQKSHTGFHSLLELKCGQKRNVYVYQRKNE